MQNISKYSKSQVIIPHIQQFYTNIFVTFDNYNKKEEFLTKQRHVCLPINNVLNTVKPLNKEKQFQNKRKIIQQDLKFK